MNNIKRNKFSAKILLTLGLICLYKVISHIPVPFVNVGALQVLSSYSIFEYVNEFNGGALSSMSLTAVGISAYISASIVIQLLSVAITPLEEISKMPGGQNLIKRLTIILGIVFSFTMSFGLSAMLSYLPDYFSGGDSFFKRLLVAMIHCVGTGVCIWIGETITEHGIGNGISLLITANIISQIPQKIVSFSTADFTSIIVIIATLLCIIYSVVFVETSEAHVPVEYAKKVKVGQYVITSKPFIPIKVNVSGVMPIIFSTMFFQIVALIGSIAGWDENCVFSQVFTQGSVWYCTIMVLMIVASTFFYSEISFRTADVAKSLQSNEGVIPGVLPGKQTEEYLEDVLKRLNLISAVYLSLASLVPLLVYNFIGISFIQATSVMIIIGTVLDFVKKAKIEYISHKSAAGSKESFLLSQVSNS